MEDLVVVSITATTLASSESPPRAMAAVTAPTTSNKLPTASVCSTASQMDTPDVINRRGGVHVGFSSGFGRMSCIGISRITSLTPPPPPGFFNFMGEGRFSEGSINNQYFFNEFQKVLDIGRSLGYNMDRYFNKVKEIVDGHEGR